MGHGVRLYGGDLFGRVLIRQPIPTLLRASYFATPFRGDNIKSSLGGPMARFRGSVVSVVLGLVAARCTPLSRRAVPPMGALSRVWLDNLGGSSASHVMTVPPKCGVV